CISYLTIEHRGEIPKELGASIGAHVYGCDICQEVCPWNLASPISADCRWQPRSTWDSPPLLQLMRMNDDEMGAALRGSAMKRAKIEGLRRNIAIATQNCRSSGPREAVEARESD